MLGSLVVEGLGFRQKMLGSPEWAFSLRWRAVVGYVIATVIRVGAGATLAAASAAQGAVTGPYMALILGITAPLVVEKIVQGGAALGASQIKEATAATVPVHADGATARAAPAIPDEEIARIVGKMATAGKELAGPNGQGAGPEHERLEPSPSQETLGPSGAEVGG